MFLKLRMNCTNCVAQKSKKAIDRAAEEIEIAQRQD